MIENAMKKNVSPTSSSSSSWGAAPGPHSPPPAPTPCTSSPGRPRLRRSSFTQGWAFRANGAFYAIFLIKNLQKLIGALRPRRAPRAGGGARTGHRGGGGCCWPHAPQWGRATRARAMGWLWDGCGVPHHTPRASWGSAGAVLEEMGMEPGLQELSTPCHPALPCPSPEGDPWAGGSACPGGGPLPVARRGAAWEAAGSSPYRTPPFPQQP